MSNEAMVNNLTNILNGLDDSQEKLEKDAFDVINSLACLFDLTRPLSKSNSTIFNSSVSIS